MKKFFKTVELTTLCLLAAACGDAPGSSASAGAGSTSRGSDTADATDATMSVPTEGGGSNSESATTEGSGSNSDSQASNSATATMTGGDTATATMTGGSTTTGDSAITVDTTTDETTQGASASEGSTGSGTTAEVGTTGTDTGSETDTGQPPCEPPSGGEQFSVLWIANTDQGSVSKIDPNTMVELARYYTDPVQSGAASPSRTSVSLDGRFVVVSNRDTGSITKIAANEVDCIDKNKDGMIQTSKDKGQLLPYAQEECILWTTKLTVNDHHWGPRGTAFGVPEWNIDTCAYENEKVWVGYMISPTDAQMARLSSYTGEIEAKVDIPNFPTWLFSPYGAAVDPDGNIWTTGRNSRAAFRIDAKTLEVKRWDSPDVDSHYGIAIDPNGRVWFANHGGNGAVSFFDPKTEQWKVIPGTNGNFWRSIAAGEKGRVWVSNNGGPLGCGLLEIDGESETITKFHTFPQCVQPLGVGLDGKGNVWMIDHDDWAWQMDPVTYEKKQLPLAGVHYTYSDFTGSGLAGVSQ